MYLTNSRAGLIGRDVKPRRMGRTRRNRYRRWPKGPARPQVLSLALVIVTLAACLLLGAR